MAGAFLIGVAVLLVSGVAYGVWRLYVGPDPIPTAPLVADLNELTPPAGATAAPVSVDPCTGEGSFGAHAARRFETTGTEDDLIAALRAQATALGWSPVPDDSIGFARDERHLSIGPDRTATHPAVLVEVVSNDVC